MSEKEPKSNLPDRRGRLKEHYLVTQANDLLSATMDLSLQARKFLACLIARISPQDETFCRYWVPVDDYMELAGIRSKANYFKILLGVASELRAVNIISKNKKLTKISGIITAAYDDEENKMVGAEFNEDLKPFLLQLKRDLTSYQLQTVMKLRSNYSYKLYNLLIRHAWKTNTTHRLEIDLLRKELIGTEKKYQKYSNFKNRILAPAQKEINAKTDIRISYKPIRKGRSFKWIDFKISRAKSMVVIEQNGDEIPIADTENILERFQKYIPTEDRLNLNLIKLINAYLESNGELYVEKQLAYTSGKKYDNFVAYLTRALEKDWGKNINPGQQDLFSKDDSKEKKQDAPSLKDYQEYKARKIEKYKSKLSSSEIKKVEAKIGKETKNAASKKQTGLKSAAALKITIRMAIENHYMEKAGVLEFDEWQEEMVRMKT